MLLFWFREKHFKELDAISRTRGRQPADRDRLYLASASPGVRQFTHRRGILQPLLPLTWPRCQLLRVFQPAKAVRLRLTVRLTVNLATLPIFNLADSAPDNNGTVALQQIYNETLLICYCEPSR